jgi:hypothetical protein
MTPLFFSRSGLRPIRSEPLDLSGSCSLFPIRSSLMKISTEHRLWSSNALNSWLHQHIRQGSGQSSRTSKQSFKTLFHPGGNPNLVPTNDELVGRGNTMHAFPSVVGMAMSLYGLCRVYYMMLLDHRTSCSLPRHMRAIFGLSRTLQDTISFQPVYRR